MDRYLPGLEDWILGSSEQVGGAPGKLSETSSVRESLRSTGPLCPDSRMSERLVRRILKGWTSCVEDSPANRGVQPGSDEARTMTVTSGLRWLELCRSYGPVGLLAKMFLGSSALNSTRARLIWKVRATPSGRLCFRLAASTRRTNGKESSSSQGDPSMWPTPHANCSTGAGRQGRKGGPNLQTAVTMWPTPTARDYKDGTAESCANVPVNALLGRAVHQNPQPQQSGSLNPAWVEWLMGFPEGWTDCEDSETQ